MRWLYAQHLFTEDQRWLPWSQEQLTHAAHRGAIVLNAVVLAEVAPRFPRVGECARRSRRWCSPLAAAFLAGHAHADYRRAGGTREAVLPDFSIGAHAAVTRRPLLTRDPRRVGTYIPGTTLIAP